MPVGAYFKGHGKEVMAQMRRKHGDRAEEVFYRTAHAKGMNPMKKMKSHGTMTKGAYGDIGAKRQEESVKVGGFKAGATVKASAKLC